MKIGDRSGCLEIIGDNIMATNELSDIIKGFAKSEWNKFDKWKDIFYYDSFQNYYNLSEAEIVRFNDKASMLESFVSKYQEKNLDKAYSFIEKLPCLYHKKRPNTKWDCAERLKKNSMYKVKCKKCGRVHYMDEKSFSCVAWYSCIGAECLASTLDENNELNYEESLYNWEQDNLVLQNMDVQLAKVEHISSPLTYYGGKIAWDYDNLLISYISDIHQLHHLIYFDNNSKRMISQIVNQLYESMNKHKSGIIVFAGDISSDKSLTLAFYDAFVKKHNFTKFKLYKSDLNQLKTKKINLPLKKIKYERKLHSLKIYFGILKNRLAQWLDFKLIEKYKKRYCPNLSFDKVIEYYKMVKSYKEKNLPQEAEDILDEIAKVAQIYSQYECRIERIEQEIINITDKISEYEKIYEKRIDDIGLIDYSHELLSDIKDVYVVLGNHEYINFPNVDSCVSFYDVNLSRLRIKLLHNNFIRRDKYLVYGGTGFAKYDEKWNADNIICCSNFTRQDEIVQTTRFEEGYRKALNYAKEHKLCFLCIAHYPISACLNNYFDREAIYFTGHNHRNEFIKKSDKVLYADNQIGYKDNNIIFKTVTTGFEINPYGNLSDGLYKSSIKDYLQFYRCIGEDIGKGTILYERCQYGQADLYVVKRRGYYAFFIMGSNGISIINGGVTKKISDSSDMDWICENFDIVLSKYLQVMLPLRNAQEKLSCELQELGLSGKIHGCIVDINYFHHIMLNPLDGTFEFYYSPSFGEKLTLDSFEAVTESSNRHRSIWDERDYKKIISEFQVKSKNSNYLLGHISNNYLLESDNNGVMKAINKIQVVSRKAGMYGGSRKIGSLQRLFSGHVLRDFDLKLTESEQRPYRSNLFLDRKFVYRGITYKVIEDTGCDIIVAEELNDHNCRKFTVNELKSEIAKKNNDTYWIY